MPINEITQTIANYKDTIWIILTWFTASITHIFNKARKWEKMTFSDHIYHLTISWFVWLMAWFVCSYLWLNQRATHIIVWSSAYLWIQIIDAVDMLKPKVIYDLFIDFIKFKIWK